MSQKELIETLIALRKEANDMKFKTFKVPVTVAVDCYWDEDLDGFASEPEIRPSDLESIRKQAEDRFNAEIEYFVCKRLPFMNTYDLPAAEFEELVFCSDDSFEELKNGRINLC